MSRKSYFRGTRPRYGKVIEAIGAEVCRNRRWPNKRNPRLPPTAFCKSGIANIFRSSAQGDGACNPTFPLANPRSAPVALRGPGQSDKYCQSTSLESAAENLRKEHRDGTQATRQHRRESTRDWYRRLAIQWRSGTFASRIELGASLIDTAEVYGTEEAVAEAIKGTRDRVFIATKVSGDHLRYDDVLRAAEGSLRRLNTTYIDLYQIHWSNPYIPIQETMHAMETLVDRGLVRYIGVSNFSTSELRVAQEAMSKYPIVSNQVLYNLNRREIESELLPYCFMNHVTVIAYTPLDDGRLATRSQFPSSQGCKLWKPWRHRCKRA